MTDTNTLINWPARLKIGARSKKGKLEKITGKKKTNLLFLNASFSKFMKWNGVNILVDWRQKDWRDG